MPAIRDYKDAILEAQAEVSEIFEAITQELTLQKADVEASRLWAQTNPTTRERFKQERPQDYEKMRKEKRHGRR